MKTSFILFLLASSLAAMSQTNSMREPNTDFLPQYNYGSTPPLYSDTADYWYSGRRCYNNRFAYQPVIVIHICRKHVCNPPKRECVNPPRRHRK